MSFGAAFAGCENEAQEVEGTVTTNQQKESGAGSVSAALTTDGAATGKAPDDNWSAKIDAFGYKGLAAAASYEFGGVTSILDGNLTSSDPAWSAAVEIPAFNSVYTGETSPSFGAWIFPGILLIVRDFPRRFRGCGVKFLRPDTV